MTSLESPMIREKATKVSSGYLMLVVLAVAQIACAYGIYRSAVAINIAGILGFALASVVVAICWAGLFMVHPNEARYGWIEGTFPSYRIRDGDHFLAWVGCIGGYNRCSLVFYLDYMDSFGKVDRLGEWHESYDGDVTKIYLDLSDLAGERVQFILGVEANTRNVEDAQGFWFVPRIDWFDPRLEN